MQTQIRSRMMPYTLKRMHAFLIEFKNGRITDQVNFEINKKIYDSLFILFDLKYTDKKGKVVDAISYTRENMTYILVYNEQNYLEYGPTKQTKLGEDRQRVSQSHHRDLLYKSMRSLRKKNLFYLGWISFKIIFSNTYIHLQKRNLNRILSISVKRICSCRMKSSLPSCSEDFLIFLWILM